MAAVRACRDVRAFTQALWVPASNFEDLSSQLRQSLDHARYMETKGLFPSNFLTSSNDIFFVDHRYNSREVSNRGNSKLSSNGFRYHNNRGYYTNPSWKKNCYVCGKIGCYSTKHTTEERQKSRNKYMEGRVRDQSTNRRDYSAFLLDYEGHEEDEEEDIEEYEKISNAGDSTNEDEEQQFFPASFLSDEAFRHRINNKENQDPASPNTSSTAFVLDRYTNEVFQGIFPDTGAARNSTVG
ncbi:integrase and RNaseH domain-containing protein [Golovinomyces cichoracearum]|uniref:Integrase and RNaseH domain-containing protein n=1 Tax=Golovinomyces cichoracearum TaxID=62708 RepID=A0A420J033_9PEZI|nr:integrase and RNaseH domain-containing protein [Golovinomyces cichoracearum]